MSVAFLRHAAARWSAQQVARLIEAAQPGPFAKSVTIIADAPLLGHGTGSIGEQFRRTVVGQTGMAALASTNPHNQVFAIAIQLGLVGALLLLAMWIAHLRFFRGAGMAAGIGLLIVAQNIISSLFNSSLFDFTHGWAYVLGVGVLCGMVLHDRLRSLTAVRALAPWRGPGPPSNPPCERESAWRSVCDPRPVTGRR
jgi:O-antigen ligase